MAKEKKENKIWLNNTRRHIFNDWVNNASYDDLKEYVVEENYPVTKRGKWNKALNYIVVLEVLLIFGIVIGAILHNTVPEYKYDNLHDDMEVKANTLTNLGNSICSQYGGLMEIDQRMDDTIIVCVDRNFLFNEQSEFIMFR
jgi:hypothetical protein